MAPPRMPSACCTLGEVAGMTASGVVVASTTWSIWSAVRPAASRAARPASVARPEVVPPKRRSRMPVRSTIQASDVSREAARSSLVTTLSGRAMPDPVILMPGTSGVRRSGADGVDADEPRVARDDAPGVDGHAQARALDLAGTGPSPELGGQLDHLGQAGGAEGVSPADQATARVHDQTGLIHRGAARFGG